MPLTIDPIDRKLLPPGQVFSEFVVVSQAWQFARATFLLDRGMTYFGCSKSIKSCSKVVFFYFRQIHKNKSASKIFKNLFVNSVVACAVTKCAIDSYRRVGRLRRVQKWWFVSVSIKLPSR